LRELGHRLRPSKIGYTETEGLEDIYRREDKALGGFNAEKEACLRVYLKAIETGKIERQRQDVGIDVKGRAAERCYQVEIDFARAARGHGIGRRLVSIGGHTGLAAS
jgi:hypothetical protein